MTEPTIDLTQWIRHDGTGRPVDPRAQVSVLCRGGRGFNVAGNLVWSRTGNDLDVIAYRLADVTELRQGDYVATEGLNDVHLEHLYDAFVSAGASPRAASTVSQITRPSFPYIAWARNGRVTWLTTGEVKRPQNPFVERQLTYQQVMDVVKAVEPKGEPAKPMWDGKGFPPLGVPFEFSRNGFIAHEPRVMLFNDGITCLMAHRDYLANRWHYKCDDPHLEFRPIRSEEDRAVDEMVSVVVGHYENPKGAESYIGLARALYRAGYRKQETPQ